MAGAVELSIDGAPATADDLTHVALVNYGVDETTNPRLRRPRRSMNATEPTPVAGEEDGR